MCESAQKRRKALHKTILKVINDNSNQVKYRHHTHNPSMGEKNLICFSIAVHIYLVKNKTHLRLSYRYIYISLNTWDENDNSVIQKHATRKQTQKSWTLLDF